MIDIIRLPTVPENANPATETDMVNTLSLGGPTCIWFERLFKHLFLEAKLIQCSHLSGELKVQSYLHFSCHLIDSLEIKYSNRRYFKYVMYLNFDNYLYIHIWVCHLKGIFVSIKNTWAPTTWGCRVNWQILKLLKCFGFVKTSFACCTFGRV